LEVVVSAAFVFAVVDLARLVMGGVAPCVAAALSCRKDGAMERGAASPAR
jgi:hypothetical protein